MYLRQIQIKKCVCTLQLSVIYSHAARDGLMASRRMVWKYWWHQLNPMECIRVDHKKTDVNAESIAIRASNSAIHRCNINLRQRHRIQLKTDHPSWCTRCLQQHEPVGVISQIMFPRDSPLTITTAHYPFITPFPLTLSSDMCNPVQLVTSPRWWRLCSIVQISCTACTNTK